MENQEKENNASTKKFHLKDGIRQLIQRIVDVFRDYPVTMIAIMLAALATSVLVDVNGREFTEFLEKAILFFLITAMQSLFFEEFFKRKWLVRTIGYVISAALAVLYVGILSADMTTLSDFTRDFITDVTAKVLCVHCVVMIGLSIWHMFRRLEDDFEAYATKAFLELLKATVVYGLFAAGLALIILIFNYLIFKTGDFLEQVEIFLASGIYVPMCLKAISGKNEAPGKFFRACILYVLLPMLLIAFGIIYLYIAKIFITNDVPSNRVFGILACLFAVGMPIWTTVHGLQQKEGFLSKVGLFLPYVFLPFVLLQCWVIGIRIAQYGFTTSRYAAVILILGELIYFVLYLLHHRGQKQAISWILFALMGIAFFGILCPGTNYEDVTIRSQIAHITKMLQKPDLNSKEQASVKSAYIEVKYLGYKGKKALSEQLTASEKDLISTFDEYGTLTGEIIYLSDYQGTEYVEVAGYSRIYRVSSAGSDSYLGDGQLKMQYSNYKFNKEHEPFLADVSNVIDYALTFTDSYSRDFSVTGHQVCPVNDYQSVWITSISISFDKNTKKIDRINLEGYLMEK